MEQLHYNLLYRWFVGLGVDDRVWVPTVFTKNRDRLLEAEVARKFLAELLAHRQVRALLSDDHFSVDGTQVQAWASMKSFVAKDGSGAPPSPGRNGERHFHDEQRSNETHSSTTDPEAKLAKKGKGKEAKLAYTSATSMLHRTWRKTRPIASPPSMVALSAIVATRSASRSASGLRSHSGGARPSADWRGQCCVVLRSSTSSSR